MANPNECVILVPIDFSPPSRRALAWAFDYAQRVPGDVHLLHIVENKPRLADLKSHDEDPIKDEMKEVIAAAKEELAQMAPTQEAKEAIGTIHHRVALGSPADNIVRTAAEIEADLIVMGTHGRKGIGRLLFGSVAEQVVRQAPCTVVCVKPTITEADDD